jgi:hypothetical protein
MDIKNPALVGALGIIAAVLGFAGWYMATHPAPAPYVNGEPVTTLETDVPAHITENADYYSIDVSYPTKIQFPLSSRDSAGAEAERVMKAWVDTTIRQFKAYASENEAAIADFIAQNEEVPASLASSYLLVNYEKKPSPRTLTYLFTSGSYTGGAHGIEVPVTFTFDRTTGAQIKLADLFVPGSDYLARLSEISRADLPRVIGEYADPTFIASGTTPEAQNFETFYLEGDRIVFLFPPYQVGPYALGTVMLPVELSRIRDIIRPEFLTQ